jgi:hypothetical protein
VFGENLAIMVAVGDEVGAIFAQSKLDNILQGWGFCEEGLDVWWEIVPASG